MGPTGDPAATRAALVDAARRAFEQDGFDGTDTNRIARAAGFSPQTFYRHFPDKLAIFVAVYEVWVESLIGASFSGDQTLDEVVEATLSEHATARVFRRDLRKLSVTDPRVRAVRARERQRQLETLRARFPSAREMPLDALAVWLMCSERIADAIVDDELIDLGVTKAEARAQLARVLAELQQPERVTPAAFPSIATRRRDSR